MKYHINKSFNVERCYAEQQVCMYRNNGHYDTEEKAEQVAIKLAKESYKLLDVSDANHPLMGEKSTLYALCAVNTDPDAQLIFIQDDNAKYENYPIHSVYLKDGSYFDRSGKVADNEQELAEYVEKTFKRDASSFTIMNKYQSKNAIYEHLGYETDDLGQLLSDLRHQSKLSFEAGDDYAVKLFEDLHNEIKEKNNL